MTTLIDNRQIRVFISSTFQDMQDERDYLMKRTFPKLRKLAAERDVTLTELDLRWGITEEESKSGKVVEICLREIENSIPFFIGIIGNRYGWVPKKEDLGGNVTERFSEVKRYVDQHLSVTEMEMQFGVLNRDEDMHAYFYIKEQEENKDNPEMLNRLKEEVRKSKYPSTTYSSPEDLAMQVEEAFTALLDDLFPNGHLSELEKVRIGQRAFMNQLCQNYIKDEKNFRALDAWLADGDTHQFVLTGASGLGKSALIANWVKEKLSEKTKNYNIIYHFTGNGGSESNSEHITKCVADEIKDQYGWTDNELGEATKLNDLFLRVSSEGKKPLLIVIDAINQIVDVDNAKLLNWLPVPGKNIKILFSTLEDDRTMEVFKNRNYPIYTLEPLDETRRSELVRSYLKLYAKSLTDAQINRIVTDSQCENTLVLKTLLDELISFGVFEKLNERIEYYLSQDTIDDFYQALLASYEEEYGEELVQEILSLIAVSRRGLSEEEILTITGIKPIQWSQFYCSLSHSFINQQGYITFSHQYITEAILSRYLYNSDIKTKYCSKIIRYFENIESNRAWEELAYQYKNCQYYDKLWVLFSKSLVMAYFLRNDSIKLWIYWQLIISKWNHYNLLIYLEPFKNDFELLLLTSRFIKRFIDDTETSLAYLLSAHKIMRESEKAVFFHVMGEVYENKSNECFRKELQILVSGGKRYSEEFADAIISVAKTNDLIGKEGVEEIVDEDEIKAIKEQILLDDLKREQDKIEDCNKTKEEIGETLYNEFADVPEYRFDFEGSLWGVDLQMAYVNQAISIIKSIGKNVQYKIASYYSYLFEILWLCPPAEYYPLLTEAYDYFVKLNTEDSPEILYILKQKAKFLKEGYYNNAMQDYILLGKVISLNSIKALHEKLLLISSKIFGLHSIQYIESLEEYANFYDMISDFESELNCYYTIYNIYNEMGLLNNAHETKEWIDDYCIPMIQKQS